MREHRYSDALGRQRILTCGSEREIARKRLSAIWGPHLQFVVLLERRFVTSRCHDSKISGSQQTVVLHKRREKKTKNDIYDYPVHDALRNKTITHTFLPSFDNANCCLCEERLFRSRNFVTLVTWPQTSPLYWSTSSGFLDLHSLSLHCRLALFANSSEGRARPI